MKKPAIFGVGFVLLLSALAIIVPYPSLAQTSIPTHYDWVGYNGNFSIYDSYCITGKGEGCYYIPYNITGVSEKFDHFVSPAYGAGSNISRKICTGLGISTGGDSIYSGGSNYSFCEAYVPGQQLMGIYIPVTSTGVSVSSNVSSNGITVYSQCMDVRTSGFSNNTNIKTFIEPGCVAGYNTYGEYDLKQRDLNLVNLSGSLAGALAVYTAPFPCISTPLSIYSGGVNVYNTINCLQPYFSLTSTGLYYYGDGSLPLNFTICQNNATSRNTSNGLIDYSNTYNTQELLGVWIHKQDFGEFGNIELSSRDTWWSSPFFYTGGNPGNPAGSVNLSIPVVPANVLYGTFYVNNEPSQNQEVKIIQNYDGYCNGEQIVFYVRTNSNGEYMFYAEPGESYGIQPVLQCGTPTPIIKTIAATNYNSTQLNLYASDVNFQETGLAPNTQWSVTLGYQTETSSSTEISLLTGNGSYSFTIGSVPGYSISPSTSTVNVSGRNVTEDITFTGDYTVTLSESGLPSGSTWEAELNNTDSYVSTTGTSISFSAGNGQYSFAVPQATERHSNGDIYTYTASPSGGDVTVSGASKTISVTFTLTSVSSGTGSGCVNATTEILMANYTYMEAQHILPGDYVLAYNITTHVYQKEEVLDTYISNHSRLYTINGILQTSAYQPILTSNGYVQAQNLSTKDRIYDAFTGKYVKITSITITNGNYTMYDFQIPPDYDFIAWEYIVYDLTIKP